ALPSWPNGLAEGLGRLCPLPFDVFAPLAPILVIVALALTAALLGPALFGAAFLAAAFLATTFAGAFAFVFVAGLAAFFCFLAIVLFSLVRLSSPLMPGPDQVGAKLQRASRAVRELLLLQ